MSRGRIIGVVVLGIILASLAAAPVLAPNPPDHSFRDQAFAPPMLPRVTSPDFATSFLPAGLV